MKDANRFPWVGMVLVVGMLLLQTGCDGRLSPTTALSTTQPTVVATLAATDVAPTLTQATVTPSPRITGRVLWGQTPVAGARVNLGTGGWRMRAEEIQASAVSDAQGRFVLDNPPAGDLTLVAVWPDGNPSMAPVTPIRVAAGAALTDVKVYLAKELPLLEPAADAEVGTTPMLRWNGLPEATQYKLLVTDAGTTALVFDLVITEITSTMQVTLPPLMPGKTYQWTVDGTAGEDLMASLHGQFRTKPGAASVEQTPTCAQAFERRELKKPYQTRGGQTRYTLSTEELNDYLAAMGITSLCIPTPLGAPFVNVDWDVATKTAATGRMLSIGFEGLYRGAGWSEGYIVYATYDFRTGSEYDVFANASDRDALREGKMPTMFEANGARGFVRIARGLSYGLQPLFLTYVFPFEKDYVAIVYNLGNYDASADVEALLRQFAAGQYPPERQEMARRFDALKSSVQFGLRRANVQNISFSYRGTLAQGVTGEIVPAEAGSSDGPWWLPVPQHVAIGFTGYGLSNTIQTPQVIVYPAGELASSNAEAAKRIASLRQMLQTKPANPEAPLPFLPLFNAAQQMQVGTRYLPFQGGQGVRFLTQYAQGLVPVNNGEIFYTFQGLSDDGKAYVAVILPVSHSMLPANAQTLSQNVEKAVSANYRQYLADTVRTLADQPDTSFSPSLADLDALVQTIAIKK